jgi:3'-phosphoadenosine 5'-phosphosulfate sulfotransferase (PAPS reductase)/FAD synthetase
MDLRSYDWIVINSSAGKDSLSMLDLIVEMATAQQVLERVLVVHADLGRVEWAGTRELAERQAQRYGLRFEVVARSKDLLSHVEQKGMWPDSQARYCTSDHKTSQVHKLFTRLVDELAPGRQVRILDCLGIRAQESPKRAKKEPFKFNRRASNGLRHVDTWLPIFTWTLDEVWARINDRGLESHPAYALGMSRLSCCFCVLGSKPDLLIAARHNPELLDAYVAVEDRIGHRFTHKFSIREIRDEVTCND